MQSVYVLAGYQTDFARNFSKEGKDIADIVQETLDGVMQASALAPAQIGAIHVGNAFGELFNRQAQLGAMPASLDARFWGKPATRHEAACASGSMAILGAMAQIQAGWHDCVLVLGAEQERNVQGLTAARNLGAAAWTGREAKEVRLLWPHMFSRMAQIYAERYGMEYAYLAEIARRNLQHAKRNPLAQTRKWEFTQASFSQDDEANPVVDGWTRRNDCGQVTDGGAAVLLANARFAHLWAELHGKSLHQLARISGWGWRTAGLSLESKLAHSNALLFPHMAAAIQDAFARAGVADVWQMDLIETHDCFAMTQYIALDHFGLTPPGEGWRALQDDSLCFGGRLPVNPSGGLIGAGHPVGASGIRMLWDCAKQVTGLAGDYQVAGAQRAACLNLGGSASTIASFVLERGVA
ncbi:acetyl-CoA acetyltransferase [Massilia sp. W12]|uniref:acetyl-CoA acetyltransferase n=1 Tax=Massilia sp. W12 TaxID=3126507 RepID=UPI0030D40F9A